MLGSGPIELCKSIKDNGDLARERLANLRQVIRCVQDAIIALSSAERVGIGEVRRDWTPIDRHVPSTEALNACLSELKKAGRYWLCLSRRSAWQIYG